MAKIQYCTFRLGELHMGVEVSRVREVLKWQEMTDVPLTDGTIAGLINLRGQIVTAVDLHAQFDVESTEERSMNVVLRTEGAGVSLLVDVIGDVVEVDAEAFEPTPETTDPNTAALLEGVYKLEGGLLLILDTAKVIDAVAVAS